MVVYADILICLNTVITYFIIIAAKAISGIKAGILRIILSSFLGGFSSLYIFLPQQPTYIELIIKLVFSAVITVVLCGVTRFKSILRFFFCFYAVSFLYAGFMIGFWYLLKPKGMVINNGVVYFSISPIVLIISTAVCYLIINFVSKQLKRDDTFADKKTVELNFEGKSYNCVCMVDTGNTLRDTLGDCKVLILGIQKSKAVFGERTAECALKLKVEDGLNSRFRLLPYGTVGGHGIMPALRIDNARIDGKMVQKVLIGISNKNFDGEVDGIISPDFLL